jgi:hypothetical protein
LDPQFVTSVSNMKSQWSTYSINAPAMWGDLGSSLSDYEENQQSKGQHYKHHQELGNKAYKNPILNRIWQLLPGFIVWKIWKERNRCIFHSQTSTPSSIWSNIFGNIQETIHAQLWTQEDLSCEPQETLILSSWKLNLHNTPLSTTPFPTPFPIAPPLGNAPLWFLQNEL